MHIQQLHLAVSICARGRVLAVLPDYVARTYAGPGALRRLPLDIIPTTPFYAVRRSRLVDHDDADVVIDLVREHAREAAKK